VKALRTFGAFWWDFVVGDEWRLAVVVGVATLLGVLAALDQRLSGGIIACGFAAGVILASCDVIVATGRRDKRSHRG
jgi:hypothetical protein